MNTARRNPKLLRNLQYFEAMVRHGSMQGASRELGVTPSAVSHQLRELTRSIGEDLFVRTGHGVRLTEAGVALAAKLDGVFEALDATVLNIVGTAQPRLRVAVCSAFGPGWMAPRLRAFRAAHPRIDVELRLYAQDPEQTQGVADCIVTARPVKPGYDSIDLFEELLVAVASPDLATPSDGTPPPLITTDIDPGVEAQDWQIYARMAGLDLEDAARGGWVRCTHYILALGLARAGLGVALVPNFLAEELLAEGKLHRKHPLALPSGRTYRLCTKEARSAEGPIRRLTAWLRRETADLSIRS